MYNKLTTVIAESGIWNGTQEQSHAFRLSPSVYSITAAQQKELALLGHAIYDCLLGLSHMAVIAFDEKLNYNNAWLLARRVFAAGVPKVYHELQGMNVRDIPRLLKVDLMVDQTGNFKIAEIDGHNKHGLGYSTLGKRFRNAIAPDAKVLPGAVALLAEEIRRQGFNKLKFFYADQERFYLPEFTIAKVELEKYGIKCQLVSETDVTENFLKSGLFLDLPFLYGRAELSTVLLRAYRRGDVSFIIPPKPCLGAKGVLALLRNDEQEEHLEAILRSLIKKESLELLRAYIPETRLLGKFNKKELSAADLQKSYVLKESISSGMKGIFFSGEKDFAPTLQIAQASNMNWILQEEVFNQPQTFNFFEKVNGSDAELKTADDWFMRVTTHYVNRKLADVIVTARQDRAVHGAKDCIQIGTVVL